MAELTQEQIRTLADQTTQHDIFGKKEWKKARIGRLTSSNFGRAISAAQNPHRANIEKLRGDIFFPKNIESIPAVKWGTDHESVAISAYVNETHAKYHRTGLWMYPNNMLGASPDGLIYSDTHPQVIIGVIEVKCPYSMRDVCLRSVNEWHNHLKFLDKDNHLKTNHPYYHQIQGSMNAVGVDWCDFIVWTPCQMLIQRIRRCPIWAHISLPRLENFFNVYIKPTELDDAKFDDNDDVFIHEPTRDLNAILHPTTPACKELASIVCQALHVHIARWIYHHLSCLRSGLKWKSAVTVNWAEAVDNICESCVRETFSTRWKDVTSTETQKEVADIVENIMEDECLWASLFYNPAFANKIQENVKSVDGFEYMSPVPCTCDSRKLKVKPPKLTIHKVPALTSVLSLQASNVYWPPRTQLVGDILLGLNNEIRVSLNNSSNPKPDQSTPSTSPTGDHRKELVEAFHNISPIDQSSSHPTSITRQLGVSNDARYSIFSNLIIQIPDYESSMH